MPKIRAPEPLRPNPLPQGEGEKRRLNRIEVDPITVEVIGCALASIVEEMGEALIRASYSTNIKERRDCSTALFDLNGNTLCQAEHIPMHLGSFIGLLPHIMKRHPIEQMQPGDVFVGNDAYEGGGTHLPDIVMAEPVFVDGRMVAWAVNLAHHADFADRGHAHIYQEGLRIPPVRLYRAGELQRDVQELILLNCQVPRERLSDLRAQMAANRLGVQRMTALCAKYGREVVLAAGDALQDYAERKMRAGIAAIPDGTYRFADRYDCPEVDGELPMHCEIRVAGDEMHLAFRRAAAGARRAEHDLHGAALDGLLRGQDGGRSDHPAECRPGAPAARDGARGHHRQLRASRGGERPARHLPARGGPDPRRAGRGGAGTSDRGLAMAPAARSPSPGTSRATTVFGSIWKRSAAAPARGRRRTGWTACTCT